MVWRISHIFSGVRAAFEQSKYSRNTQNEMLIKNDLCLNLHVHSPISEQPMGSLPTPEPDTPITQVSFGKLCLNAKCPVGICLN